MISASQIFGRFVPSLIRHQNHLEVAHALNKGCRSSAAVSTANAGRGLSHQLSRQPRSLAGVCRAEEHDVGGYTPANYISFSEDPDRQCHHHAEVVVDAPIDACFSLWSDWVKLLDFLDLIGQIGLDNNTPEMALFQCFYRWRKLPTMEIVFLLERVHVEANKCIAFRSVYGMPIAGQVDLQEQADGQTKVQLYFTHPVPTLLVQMQVGPFGMETHMMQILKENMATYKAKVEALAPADWQQAKQQVAARVKQQQQQEQEQQPEQQAQPLLEQQQQQQQQQQSPQQAAAADRKQRTSRRTTAATTSSSETSLAAAAAAAGAGGQARSRSGTSRRTASVAAAEAAASSGSSSSTAGRRRSRTATGSADAGNGTGQQQQQQQHSSTKQRRSTTSRRAASAREQ